MLLLQPQGLGLTRASRVNSQSLPTRRTLLSFHKCFLTPLPPGMDLQDRADFEKAASQLAEAVDEAPFGVKCVVSDRQPVLSRSLLRRRPARVLASVHACFRSRKIDLESTVSTFYSGQEMTEEQKRMAKLSQALRRICTPKPASGKLEVHPDVYKQWMAGGTQRQTLMDTFVKCGEKKDWKHAYIFLNIHAFRRLSRRSWYTWSGVVARTSSMWKAGSTPRSS